MLSTVFGGMFDIVATPDLANDYWLLVAFRRMAVESFLKSTLGQAHLTSMNWLRVELFARLVELGYDTHPLSSEGPTEGSDHDDTRDPQHPEHSESFEGSKFAANNW